MYIISQIISNPKPGRGDSINGCDVYIFVIFSINFAVTADGADDIVM